MSNNEKSKTEMHARNKAGERANYGKQMPVGMKRTHQNCIDKTGVARPGKTAKDRARRSG